jgi:hypothetical protein
MYASDLGANCVYVNICVYALQLFDVHACMYIGIDTYNKTYKQSLRNDIARSEAFLLCACACVYVYICMYKLLTYIHTCMHICRVCSTMLCAQKHFSPSQIVSLPASLSVYM